jgi:hypothetical protein
VNTLGKNIMTVDDLDKTICIRTRFPLWNDIVNLFYNVSANIQNSSSSLEKRLQVRYHGDDV